MANWLARAQATVAGSKGAPRAQHPLSNAEAANSDTARRWQVHFPNIEPVEVIFAPEATRAEVAAIYPGASIETLPDPPPRMATPAEANKLREVVALVLSDADNAERKDVLKLALADAESALTSFRLLAADAIERKRHQARFGEG